MKNKKIIIKKKMIEILYLKSKIYFALEKKVGKENTDQLEYLLNNEILNAIQNEQNINIDISAWLKEKRNLN